MVALCRRPLDIDYIHSTSSSSKRAVAGKEKAATPESPAPTAAAANYFKKGSSGDDNAAAAAASAGGGGGNYKLFSELEAIYKPGSGGGGGAGQTGSGSGLTGDDNAMLPAPSMAELPGAAAAAGEAPQANMSETSAGEDAAAVVQPQQPPQPQQQASVGEARRKQRKRRRHEVQQQQLSASASFFERLVQRLMEHQEGLHRQFLDAMERRERDRAARDEAWRRQEAEKFAREAAARAKDRASAAAREQAIVAYLEKLSGEAVVLPPPDDAASHDAAAAGVVGRELVPYDGGADASTKPVVMSPSSRWPKHEVEALIRVRSGLDGRFQEPGLKGPLWEEVSTRMAAAGYGGRSAKRCKEKWENINKYFRKAKESGKKRPAHAKTCPYFDELDRLYSRTGSSGAAAAANSNAIMAGAGKDDAANKQQASSELLDAVVVKYPADTHYGQPPGFASDQERKDVDGAARDNGEDHDMGRTSVRAADDDDQDDEVDQSHGHDDDH